METSLHYSSNTGFKPSPPSHVTFPGTEYNMHRTSLIILQVIKAMTRMSRYITRNPDRAIPRYKCRELFSEHICKFSSSLHSARLSPSSRYKALHSSSSL